MTVSEFLAKQLSAIGIKHVYGIPGGPSIPYMESLRAAGIEFILVSNEAAAGIMADVEARLTGIPGVCHATFGPGATNITTGAGGALLDRSPVIVLTSEIEKNMIHRTTQMNIDHQNLFGPLTKATFRLSPANAYDVIHEAIRICQEEFPGPVHIGLPSDISNAEIAETNSYEHVSEDKIYENNADTIISLIRDSRNPLIAVGLTAVRNTIGDELLNYIEKTKIPVVLTPMAKGLIPEDHQCYTGVLFHALSDYLGDIFERTDLVIGIGYDPVEYNYESWMPQVPLIHFDTKEMDMPDYFKVEQFIGRPGEWFDLLNKVEPDRMNFNASLLDSLRDEMASVFNGFTDHFGPVTALKVSMEELPSDVMVTADVGSHLHLIGQYWKTWGRSSLIMTNGWSGMGFGIPAALAAQLVHPEKRVVCITGDGGFLMMAGEIITARRYNLPVIIIVLTDGELNLIRLKQSWKELAPYGTNLYSGDLFESDYFLGIRVISADTEESMRNAINSALSFNQPVIINARIDPDDYKWLIVRR